MGHNKNLASYADIRAVFEQVLKHGTPLRYTLNSPGAAVRWRARAYHFRARTEVSEYKSFLLRIEPAAPTTVIIDREQLGQLTGPDGQPIAVAPSPELTPEEREAIRLAKELGIDK